MAGRSYFSVTVAQRGIGSAWDAIIQQAAAARGLEPALLKAIISAESAWDPNAVSFNNSSFGLMQLNVHAQGITVAQANDPAFAIPWGADVILGQIRARPSLDLAIAGYNAGTSRANADLQARVDGNVNGVGGYVATILDYLTWFLANDVAGPQPGFVAPPQEAVAPDATLPTGLPPADGGAGAAPFRPGPDDRPPDGA